MTRSDLQTALDRIRPVDPARKAAVQARLDRQTKPPGSLGRLEEICPALCRHHRPGGCPQKGRLYLCRRPRGGRGGGQRLSPGGDGPDGPQFRDRGAAINALARHAGAEVIVVDMGVDYEFGPMDGLLLKKVGPGTGNIARGPAMSREQAVRCLETGIELAAFCKESGIDLVGTGDMGIANTTPSAAIAAVLTGLSVAEVTHRGTGIDDAALARKVRVIETALQVNPPDPKDPVDVLAKVGGFEIGGIAGLILGCAALGIPVVVDGFISTAGALIAANLHPHVRIIFAAHQSVEIGHRHMLERSASGRYLTSICGLAKGPAARWP